MPRTALTVAIALFGAVVYACGGSHASTTESDGGSSGGCDAATCGTCSDASCDSGASSSSSSSSSGGSSSGSSSGVVTPYQACWNADDGGPASTQACGAVCCKAAYPAGWADFYDYSAECMCAGVGDAGADGGSDAGYGPCAAACASTFCQTHDTASIACTTCLDSNSQPGEPCDFTSGFIAASCSADPQCNLYQGCFSGCP